MVLHTDWSGYYFADDIIDHTDTNIRNGKKGYYNLDWNTDDDIQKDQFESITFDLLVILFLLFFVSQTDYLLTHIFPQIHTNTTYTYTHTRTNVVSIDNLILFVALLWRAGRVLYEGLTRWLRYCLDREIDQ